MPFRDAHARVGRLVRMSLEPGSPSLEALVTDDDALGPEAAELVRPGVAITRRTTAGGAGPAPVARQRERLQARIAEDARRTG
jgi:argininosuccinate lyase